MNCPICDAQLADSAKFCGICGTPVTPAASSAPVQPVQPVQAQPESQWNAPQQPAQVWNNTAPPVQAQPAQQQWNTPAQSAQMPQNQYYGGVNNQPYAAPAQNYYQGYNPQPVNQPQMKMNWFKFLIYFSLFAGALMNLSQGFLYLTGSIYETLDGIDSSWVYMLYEDLESADKLYGLLLIAVAVIDIVARFSLAGFKKNGPMLINIAYILPIVSSVIYVIMVSGVVGDLTDATLTSFSSIITGIIFMLANAVYFKKRKHMFVN